MRLIFAGKGRALTLDHIFIVFQTSLESTPRGRQRHVDRSMALESLSSSAIEPISGPKVASLKQRTRSHRSFRSRDSISGHIKDHEEAHGGWRRT